MDFPNELIEQLKIAQHVAVLTGAGISKESGIPTFREAQTGLWAQYDPAELATPQAFQHNPKLVWEWYASRRRIVNRNQPNFGHHALVEMESYLPEFTLITQNVDGYHQAAGSQKVVELHGNIMRSKRWDDGVLVEDWIETDQVPPRCPETGSLLRPDVVWFGENLPEQALASALDAARNCDVFFSVGTSALVHPAAALPRHALEAGATLIEINPTETPITSIATYVFQRSAGDVLPELVKAVWGR